MGRDLADQLLAGGRRCVVLVQPGAFQRYAELIGQCLEQGDFVRRPLAALDSLRKSTTPTIWSRI